MLRSAFLYAAIIAQQTIRNAPKTHPEKKSSALVVAVMLVIV